MELRIETALDAVEAIGVIYNGLKNKTIIFDLILTDENMPFLKGSLFARVYNEILFKNGFYKVPIVSVSSEGDCGSKSVKVFDYYLNKPSKKKDINMLLIKYFLEA